MKECRELLERWENGEEIEEPVLEALGQTLLSSLMPTNVYLGPCIMASGGFDTDAWKNRMRPKLFRDSLRFIRGKEQ